MSSWGGKGHSKNGLKVGKMDTLDCIKIKFKKSAYENTTNKKERQTTQFGKAILSFY